MWKATVSALMAMLAAPAPAEEPGPATLQARVAAIFAPYNGPDMTGAVWDRPIFSRHTAALIAQWRATAPSDEPDALSDGDWLCLCQDWDKAKFRAVLGKVEQRGRGEVRAHVRLDLGWDTVRQMQLVMVRQGGEWLVDDIVAADFPDGLKQALRETIAENRKLLARP
jgi:hypothetical protein